MFSHVCVGPPASSHSPKTCNMGIRSIGHSKLSVGVRVNWLFVSVMDWRTVQGLPHLLPYVS